jgi:signal transduction histidine kinase
MVAMVASVEARERVLLELAKRDKSNVSETFRAITEAAATAAHVERASIWHLLPDAKGLACEDLYLASQRRHESGALLCASKYPSYFRALFERRVIPAHDACTDPRTREFAEGYLVPLGITSIMDVPIWHHGQLHGVLRFEHCGPLRTWQDEEQAFASNLADLAALSLEASERIAVEKQWEMVIDAITDPVYVLDSQLRLVRCNAAGQELLERADKCITLDERLRLIEWLDATGRPLPLQRWPGPRAIRGEAVNEVLGLRLQTTGETFYFQISIARIMDGDRIDRVVGVFRDVDDEVHFDRLKRDFLSAIAHELKTPVTITKGYAQLMSQTQAVPDEWRPMLDAIGRASRRMERLIDDLVEISGVTLGRLVLTREPTDLGALVGGLVEQTARAAPKHQIRFQLAPCATVLVDRARIEQTVRALLENALRYSPSGGEIEVRLALEDGSALLSVRDHGVGIPVDKQRHLFQLFFRAHAETTHDVGGLGIGLFLAREIARRHGGETWFESREGQGSTFYLRLPLDVGPA